MTRRDGWYFFAAAAAFQQVLQSNPQDSVAALFHRRAGQYTREPVPEGWTGVEMMRGK